VLEISRVITAAAVFFSASAGYAGETPYPTRPVRLIVTFAPGGGVDFVARTLGAKLTENWRQQVVIDNRGGGGGVIGTEIAAKAAPDGYTLLVGTSTGLVANPLLQSKLSYDTFNDFAPITMLVVTTQLLVAHPSLPIASVKDLIAYAKANTGKLSYASAGQGAPNHLGTELLKWMTGTNMVHIPYKGAGPGITDLISGRVQFMFNPAPPLLPHVNAGRLRALAVGNEKRSRILPDLPTVAEAGVAGFSSAPWYALYAPAKTTAAIIKKLTAELTSTLNDDAVSQRLVANGAEPRPSTPAELTAFMRDESERLRKVIVAAGIRAE
jgi:tripartite-type tricarboxylate transporter receptor subunit TctC